MAKGNTCGRLRTDLLGDEKAAYDAMIAALNDLIRAKNYEQAKKDFRNQLEGQQAAENGANRTIQTVENVGDLKGVVHDSVDGITAIGGLHPAAGPAADVAGLVNTAARGYSGSTLLDILPNTGTDAFSGLDAVGVASGSGSLVAALPSASAALGRAAPFVGLGTDALGAGTYAAQIVQRGGGLAGLRSAVPRFNVNVGAMSPTELRGLADRVDALYRPGWLERANGVSSQDFSSDLREIANRKESASKVGPRTHRSQDPGQTSEEAQAKYEEAKRKYEAIGMCIAET